MRKLGAGDVEAYRELRLRALRESSRTFSDSFDDERDRPLSFFESCIGARWQSYIDAEYMVLTLA